MNLQDKIPELVKRCWEDEKPNGLHSIDTGFHLNLEKYTELIVRECLSIVENLSPGYDDYRNQIEDAFRKDCIEEIKERFGVKYDYKR